MNFITTLSNNCVKVNLVCVLFIKQTRNPKESLVDTKNNLAIAAREGAS